MLSKQVCQNKECLPCYQKSFACSDKVLFWNFNLNKILPRDIFLNSSKKCWFTCEHCEHEFHSTLHNITSGKNWCPFCSNQKLCNNNDCLFCYKNSFASHEKAKYWDYDKNKILPRDIFLHSSKKCWFKCEKKHEFDTQLCHIASEKQMVPLLCSQNRTKITGQTKRGLPLSSARI